MLRTAGSGGFGTIVTHLGVCGTLSLGEKVFFTYVGAWLSVSEMNPIRAWSKAGTHRHGHQLQN